MKYLPFNILLFIFVIAAPCYGLDITFQPQASVKDNHIVLGDLATFSETNALSEALSTIPLCPSPEPGESLQLSSPNIIKTILRGNPLPQSTQWLGSSVIQIKREGVKITSQIIEKEIAGYIDKNRHKLPQAKISFNPKKLPLPFFIPRGNIDWEIIPSDPDILGSGRFTIIIRVDDRVRKNFSINGELEVMASVAVATNDIRRGEILTPANIAMKTRNINTENAPAFSLRDLLGKRSKQYIRKGGIIQTALIEIPPLIHKGQIVKIVINQGPLHISTSGIARNSGREGDVIRVQNLNSKKLIFCQITAPGIVEVYI